MGEQERSRRSTPVSAASESESRLSTSADLVDSSYLVCHGCKEGKNLPTLEEAPDRSTFYEWVNFHTKHTAEGVQNVPARVFLSELLLIGYIDVDRETLEPLPKTGLASTGDKPAPFGEPGGTGAARELQRSMARDMDNRPPNVRGIVHSTEPPASIPAMAPRKLPDLTIREIQAQFPWTIKYSQDFRLNPQSHKDFAHAITHATKAIGRLAGMIDDLDHRRESEETANAGKLLADLVICALRASNTMPGRIIDLQREVIDRIESKNEAVLKDSLTT